MAYNDLLAARARRALGDRTDVTEKRMFGGLTFSWLLGEPRGGDFRLRIHLPSHSISELENPSHQLPPRRIRPIGSVRVCHFKRRP
jgi:hypothetical protein